MQTVLAIVIGVLYATGVYMVMRRSLVKLIIGLVLLSNGANLLIFTAGRISRAHPPVIPPESAMAPMEMVNPLPQALVLTAIVIAFGVLAFTLVLFHRAHQVIGTDDLDAMTTTDR